MENRHDVVREREFYKNKIIEMVSKIENIWILEQILQVVQSITKED